MGGEPRRGLLPDAGEPGQLLDQPLDGQGVAAHGAPYIRPGICIPPVIFAISAEAISWALRTPSFTAAMIRSCSISTSSGLTTSFSIFRERTSNFPLTRHRDHPAAGGRLDGLRRQLLLELQHPLLHLLGLLHDVSEILHVGVYLLIFHGDGIPVVSIHFNPDLVASSGGSGAARQGQIFRIRQEGRGRGGGLRRGDLPQAHIPHLRPGKNVEDLQDERVGERLPPDLLEPLVLRRPAVSVAVLAVCPVGPPAGSKGRVSIVSVTSPGGRTAGRGRRVRCSFSFTSLRKM